MELTQSIIEGICPKANFKKLIGGEIIFCELKRGKELPKGLSFLGIEDGDICIATDINYNGNFKYDSSVNLEKIRNCKYCENKN